MEEVPELGAPGHDGGPRVAEEDEAFGGVEGAEPGGQAPEVGGRVADPVVARGAGVDDGDVVSVALGVEGDDLGCGAEQDAPFGAAGGTDEDGDLPVRPDRARTGGRRQGERLLGQGQGGAIAAGVLPVRVAHGDEGEAALEDPGVHDAAHGLAAGRLDGVPEVGRLGVAEPVGLEVAANTGAKRLLPEVPLEHAQDARPLLIGEDVEHALGLVGGTDGVFDRPGGVEGVGRHGQVAFHAEADPAPPFGAEGVDAEELHQSGEGFVQPDAVPPFHGDEVAEPHMGDLVGDDVGDALELEARGTRRIDEEEGFAEGHAPQVFHGTEGEVGDGEEVELLGRVGDAEPPGEEAQGVGGDLEGERRQIVLAGDMDDPHRGAVDVDRLGGDELADDESHEVGRHHHGVGEEDAPRTVGQR